MYYRDLREYIDALRGSDALVTVDRPIDKDTEMVPLVRWQFRGLPEAQRRAFLFDRPVDASGRRFEGRSLVACYAPSRRVYALGMGCAPDQIHEKWLQAQLHPLAPRRVGTGPCQEEVHEGDGLLAHGGLLEFPISTSTPGFDNAPYLTAAQWVSMDPETGVHNVGTYRSMLKAADRCGANATENKHLAIHRRKWRERGFKTMPAAMVIGVLPSLAFCCVSVVPYGTCEYDVAGGIAGEPMELVRCRTSDLLVPAHAEIVVEGEIDTELVERDGPFGEYTGYVGRMKMAPFFRARCITHRREPVYVDFLSQFPPSESSKLRQVAAEAVYLKTLRYDANVPSVTDVAFHESGGARQLCVIRMKKTHPSQVWQALHAAIGLDAHVGKMIVAVDEDIDPWDAESVNWALSFRMQPHRDIEIVRGHLANLDPSGAPPGTGNGRYPEPPRGGSAMLVDATRKWGYPPVSLPRREFMEHARELWEQLGLPPLAPRTPWHGYALGHWTETEEQEARLALEGRHMETGEKLRATRRRDV